MNSPSTFATDDLAALRAEIDRVDDALHELLRRRADIVARLLESRAKGSGPALRPGREAQITRRLLARHSGPMPRAALLRIWREILASSTAQQGSFAVVAQGEEAEALARLHFGLLAPLRTHATPARALAAVTSGDAAVAVLPLPRDDEPAELVWWPRLDAAALQVVARLPFLAPQGESAAALVVSAVPADPSGRDHSLLRFEPGGAPSRSAVVGALETAGLPATRLLLRRQGGTTLALADIAGFLTREDARLAALPFDRIDILGAYADPEPGDPA